MYLRHLRTDLIKNKGANVAIALILILSTFLMSTGAMVMERLVGSVDALFAQALPPHFLQMHKGDYNADALTQFASHHPEIESWFVEEMVGFGGSTISWQRPTTEESDDFSDSLIDNLFVTQNSDFDFLIDETGTIAQPSAGEVYVPVVHQLNHGLEIGDRLLIRTETGGYPLTVRGFVRDSQMASSLSSATRFLVAEEDFRALTDAGGGDPEIIVEYLLTDASLATQLQAAYESDDAVPKNGQAVTYQQIRLINAFSDGLVAVALIFVSGLLILIALLALRFVIRGTLEDEVHEIGAMKAIGLPEKTISGLYLARYSAVTLFACIIGGALSIGAAQVLTRSVQHNYAESSVTLTSFLVPVVALLVVYLAVIGMCRGVLRGVARVQVVGALVHGSLLTEQETARRARRQSRGARRSDLTSARAVSLNRRLALLGLRADLGQWILIPVVFFLTAVLVILPMNLLTTFESPRFVTYMGAPESDLRVDLQFSDDVHRAHQQMLTRMRADDRIVDVKGFANILQQTRGEDGWEAIRVEVGDHFDGTIEFMEGGAPGVGEIALSVMNANRFQMSVGDEMPIRDTSTDSAGNVSVSGVYQDVTSGGRTAKMQGAATTDALGYVIYADVAQDIDPLSMAREYSEEDPTVMVIPMGQYVEETLGSITSAFRSTAILAGVLGIGAAWLITVLFLTLHLTRERATMGALTAVGFSSRELVAQVIFKVVLMVSLGTLAGTAFAATAGESLVGGLIALSGFGITSLEFISKPWLVYLAYPVALIATGFAAAWVLSSRLRTSDKSAWLNP